MAFFFGGGYVPSFLELLRVRRGIPKANVRDVFSRLFTDPSGRPIDSVEALKGLLIVLVCFVPCARRPNELMCRLILMLVVTADGGGSASTSTKTLSVGQ